ncbi:MAG: AAA family ATPase [Candidatus Fimadaptatus sp.]|jgi:cytidylate kinase
MSGQIITLGRQFGSGGREVGQTIARKLDIPFYDKELITMAAEQSGISAEVFEKADEKASNTLLYALLMSSFPMSVHPTQVNELPLNDKLFLIQFDIIKRIAKAGPCVIVGRCANYILREQHNVVNAFIHAPMDARIERVMRIYSVDRKGAEDMIAKNDKRRANYYNYFTNAKWADITNYDIAVNSHKVGVEGAADMVIAYARAKQEFDKGR